ncbi:30S ribosomal protein S16 [Acidobacteria bacterium AH-259-G07]|nr:30S ribosomal protein S16 [Acidobacteria bacterium AH-259-L09]MDA2927629.1 30S ribosomal protein S16 [Acidobacteria bacterium AH-259-G07]
MLRIRLSRHGAKKDPHYRVVVAERSRARDGRFVEIVGYYNPALKPVRLNLDLDRIDYWVKRGAQPSQTVRALINKVRQST